MEDPGGQCVPDGHFVGVTVLSLQKAPAGHKYFVYVVGQKYEGGHCFITEDPSGQNVPLAHIPGSDVFSGQNVPFLHMFGVITPSMQ